MTSVLKRQCETRSELTNECLIPWYITGVTAIICAATLVLIAFLGPVGQEIIQYRTSQSCIWQIAGQDLTNLVLITPILLIGGILCLARKTSSKYLLILTPITLMYTGLSMGIGQEWSNSAYSGNVEDYWWLFGILIIGGLILLLGSLSMFTGADAPDFKPRGLRIYVGLMTVFFLLFAVMWISQIQQVTNTGDLPDGSYKAAPTAFWTIRYLDLGISIPLGFLALFLMLSKPKKAYAILLLFFGFFITIGTTVDMMAIVQVLNGDTETAKEGLFIFSILTFFSYRGLFYLVKDKLHRGVVKGSDNQN
ncbi:hypothetical protein MSBRW_1782 [Methanosarcina barkeri str. Wiesmoor]|uniref:Uncharacterized protein n=2 Tax=Methanosarcina barkeri TaxID=2208 RepID=A0A0E3QMR0_METBA|nr:hypothetical protein [Methanosarcina barkeri]AKB51035.1 hypothetical protein MSBRW_1782 [Methanosarcina barkeri str. Wiesmoor]